MKVCFPVENDNGMDSMVYAHFGSAPLFILYDSETNELEVINNSEYAPCSWNVQPFTGFEWKSS